MAKIFSQNLVSPAVHLFWDHYLHPPTHTQNRLNRMSSPYSVETSKDAAQLQRGNGGAVTQRTLFRFSSKTVVVNNGLAPRHGQKLLQSLLLATKGWADGSERGQRLTLNALRQDFTSADLEQRLAHRKAQSQVRMGDPYQNTRIIQPKAPTASWETSTRHTEISTMEQQWISGANSRSPENLPSFQGS